jgi:hypothetical protein
MQNKNFFYHWYEEPEGTRISLDNKIRCELLQLAIKRAGGAYKLAKIIRCCPQTIYNYSNGVSMTVGFLKKLLIYLCISFDEVEKYIKELSWLKNPKLPFNFNTKSGAILIGAFLSDGSNSTRVLYKNSKKVMIEKIIEGTKNVFGEDVTIDFRISDEGVPTIFLPRIVGRALSKFGVVCGKKVRINPSLPDIISNGGIEIKTAYLRQVFDDEGEVSIYTRRVILTRGVEVTKLLPKSFILSLKIGNHGVSKIPIKIKEKLKRKFPKLLFGESQILHKLGINNKIRLKRIAFHKSGYVTAIWNLIISGKENLCRFKEMVGFTIQSKRDSLQQLLNSYTRPKRDPKIYSQILNAAEEKIKEKGYFKIRDIMVSTGLCYNSVKKRIVRLKKLNKIVIIEQGKYTIEKNVRGSTFW